MYSDGLLRRFHDPKWAGDLGGASAIAMEGNPVCGDVVQISLRLEDGAITDARFRTLGCAVAIAASDALCEIISGKTLTAAEVVDLDDIVEALSGIPDSRESCASAPLSALRAAIGQVRYSLKA